LSRKAVIVTGELSGELHAVHLVRAIADALEMEFSGMGSTRLADAGVKLVHDYRDISLTGLSEVFFKAGHIWKAYFSLTRHLREIKPDLLILVDFPGFNLRIARVAKRLGIPTLYFIPPQIWAWRKNRMKQIKSWIDLVLCILPFEEALYREHHVPATYIGHPFLHTVRPRYTREAFRSMFAIREGAPVITIMPGSRQNEARRHMPVLTDIVRHLQGKLGRLTVLLPIADTMDEAFFVPFIRELDGVIPIKGLPYDCLAHSDAAVIASGSATLEAAILGVPSVVLYKISNLSYLIARMVVHVSHISLPNIIAGREIFPEFVQCLDAERIANTVVSMVNSDKSALQKEMEEVRKRLATPDHDPYRIACAEILQFLERRYGPLPETP
jgi:lipid-A-disaccharide synthase